MRPIFAFATVLVAGIVVLILATAGSAPVADASFHEMRIYGVMGGADNDSASQFVELRQASGGQNQVQNAQICFYDEDGVPWARFVFPAKADSGASNSSILIGTQTMAADWHAGGAQPDFIFSAATTTALGAGADVNAPIPQPNGAIVYESKTDSTCGSPSAIDSLSYGTGYTGASFFGAVYSTDLPVNGDGFELNNAPVAFPPANNSTEYHVESCIVARNNAGQQGTVGDNCAPEETPTPTSTSEPSATPAPSGTPTPGGPQLTQGDNDCDGDADAVDGLVALQSVAGLPYNQQPDCINLGAALPAGVGPDLFGDIDCDGDVDAVDALQILRYVAGLPVNQNPACTAVGQPL